MNTPQITDLIADAKLALETIEFGKSPVFRKAAAAWLESIAKQLQGTCAETEPEKQEEPPATIDLRMKYRTPETDKFAERIGDMPHGMTNPRYRLCRDLERRLAACRDALGHLMESDGDCGARNYAMIRETLTLTAPKR
jgi:hypothetical protein